MSEYGAEGGHPWMMDIDDLPRVVSQPNHYKLGEREVIDVIRDAGWLDHYLKGNITKYVLRCEHKGTEHMDMQKAAKCAAMWLEEFGG